MVQIILVNANFCKNSLYGTVINVIDNIALVWMSFCIVDNGCLFSLMCRYFKFSRSWTNPQADLIRFAVWRCVVLTNMHIVNRRNNKTMGWLSEVRYVGVLMPESCFPGSNKLSAPLMSILIESHALADRQVPYRRNLRAVSYQPVEHLRTRLK